jgi:hypothetical protein
MTRVWNGYAKWLYAIILAVFMTLSLVVLWCFLPGLQRALLIDIRVPWDNRNNVTLQPGPSWFVYDQARNALRTGRPIDDNRKRELQALVREGPTDRSYLQSLDQLAFDSNEAVDSEKVTSLIMALGALCGVLGVLSRSISSFVFHACVLQDLNLSVWWPWYWLRPFLGASVGVTLVVLLKSRLLPFDEPDQYAGFWLLGLCILAGFGIDEFTNRVFYLSRTLFGESTGEADKTAAATSSPADRTR